MLHAICNHAMRSRTTAQVENYFGHKPIYEQIQFFCGSAAISIAKGRDEKDKTRKTDFFSHASKQLNNAKILNDEEQLVHLGLGFLSIAKVRWEWKGYLGNLSLTYMRTKAVLAIHVNYLHFL